MNLPLALTIAWLTIATPIAWLIGNAIHVADQIDTATRTAQADDLQWDEAA